MRSSLLLTLLLVAIAFAGCAEQGAEPNTDPNTTTTPAATTPAGTPATTPATGDASHECVSQEDASKRATNPTWVLETSAGTMRMTLFCDKAPETTMNIVKLTEQGYFDGTKFHRVIEGFMNQGGDPLTKDDAQASRWGTGGPGYTIVDEFYCADGSISTTHPATCPTGLGLKHETAGTLSMANTGRAHTGGSQFFITADATPWLDGKHAIFGHTADEDSLAVALAINRAPTASGDRPDPPIVLARATIEWG